MARSNEMDMNSLNEMARGFMTSRLLLTALELDVFRLVDQGRTAARVAGEIGADPRATEMLLDALAAVGLLHKREGVFANTELTMSSLGAPGPDNVRVALLHLANQWRRWSTLTECVRKGTSVTAKKERTRESLEAFIAAMHTRAVKRADRIVELVGAKGMSRILDVGGGSGAYSAAFARANPELAAEILDLPAVVHITRRYIEESGFADRISVRPGDLMTDPLGSGFDCVLLFAICHMLSEDENRDLFRRCRKALGEGGRLVISDYVLGPDRTSPAVGAIFALNMLVSTRAGRSYSELEYKKWLRDAGFGEVSFMPSVDQLGLLIASTPA